MYQGGDRPLQGQCGGFDSHRFHDVLLSLLPDGIESTHKRFNSTLCVCEFKGIHAPTRRGDAVGARGHNIARCREDHRKTVAVRM